VTVGADPAAQIVLSIDYVQRSKLLRWHVQREKDFTAVYWIQERAY
jgi:hypothetical protein